jgi:uncharacterized protein YjbI with pentapeptide repeats
MSNITPEKLRELIESHGRWLRDEPNGSRADLSGADLRGAVLSGADLRGAVLRGADLRGAVLSGADLRGAVLSDAVLSDAVLRGADLRGADLRGAVLSGADLRGAVLSGAVLSGADLSDAVLSDADLSDADLSDAVLSDAVLRGAVLRGADLDKRYIQISCIGSRKEMTTYCFKDDHISCGCFPDGTYKGGTLDEFETAVRETHANNPQYLAEYLGFIGYIRSLKEAAK